MSIGIPDTTKNISFGGSAPGTITFLDDWSYLNPEKFSYSSDNLLTVSGIDARKFLGVGDPLKINQS